MNRNQNGLFPIVGALSAIAATNAFCGLGAGTIIALSCLFTLLMRPLLKYLFSDLRPAETACIAFFTAILGFLSDKFLYYRLEPLRPYLPFLAADASLLAVGGEKRDYKNIIGETCALFALTFFTGIIREMLGSGSLFGVRIGEKTPFFASIAGALFIFAVLLLFPNPLWKKSLPLSNAKYALGAFVLTFLSELASAEFSYIEATLKTAIFVFALPFPLYYVAKRIRATAPPRIKKTALVLSAGFFCTALYFVRFL